MQRDRVGRAMRPIERVRERRDAARDERVELLAARALDEVQLVAHAAALPRRCAAELLQVRFDERIDVAVHHALHVGNLELGAVVVDHRVRLEDVAADLAAEAHVGLRRVQLRLLLRLLVRLELIEPVLQHLHRRRLVLVLRALLLRRDDDARSGCA